MEKEDLNTYKDSYTPAQNLHYRENELNLTHYAKKICELHKGGSCLDLGLGHGFAAGVLCSNFERYVVIEGSSDIIANYVPHPAKPEIVHSYFEDFSTDEKFDVIVMGFILEHVDDPLFLLNKYKSFLKPDGSLYIAVPNYETLNKRIALEAGMIESLYTLSDADRSFGHKRLFTVASLRELINKAGLQDKLMEGLFLKPVTTRQMEALNFDDNVYRALMKIGVAYPELSVGIFALCKI